MIAPGNKISKSSSQGFTLVELLVTVAIIGILASVAVANLLNALDKGKQKRSMSDLRAVGGAVETYAIDNANYPMGISDWAGLRSTINPVYFNNVASEDGWGNTWDVGTTATGSEYTVGSFGKDGVAGARTGGSTSDFNCDIVYVNGHFFQWPEGTQS